MEMEEIIELAMSFLPETLEGWAAFGVVSCALVSLACPAPSETAHPAWKISHRIISVIGMGASKIRTARKIGSVSRSILGKKP